MEEFMDIKPAPPFTINWIRLLLASNSTMKGLLVEFPGSDHLFKNSLLLLIEDVFNQKLIDNLSILSIMFGLLIST